MLNVCKLYELMGEVDIKNIKQLSKKAKIPYNTLIYMVNGHDMHVSTLIELARFFKVPIDYLINTSYGVTIVGNNVEKYIDTRSIIEATYLGML